MIIIIVIIVIIIMIIIIKKKKKKKKKKEKIMKNCNRCSSHGHHDSKRRKLVQHAHSRGSHAFIVVVEVLFIL